MALFCLWRWLHCGEINTSLLWVRSLHWNVRILLENPFLLFSLWIHLRSIEHHQRFDSVCHSPNAFVSLIWWLFFFFFLMPLLKMCWRCAVHWSTVLQDYNNKPFVTKSGYYIFPIIILNKAQTMYGHS